MLIDHLTSLLSSEYLANHSFHQDMFIILFSSCTNSMPSLGRLFGGQSGYHRVGAEPRGGRGRDPDHEDENRLIDSLDESWEE